MPRDERRERWRLMMSVLRLNDIEVWRQRFLDALQGPGAPAAPRSDAAATARACTDELAHAVDTAAVTPVW
jgi:trehalose-6-phosphate synthase